MGKYKETESKAYESILNNQSNEHFVQPTFFGLIELFRNLATSGDHPDPNFTDDLHRDFISEDQLTFQGNV